MIEVLSPLLIGILLLAFDRTIASAMQRVSIRISGFLPKLWRWPHALPTDSQQSYENFLGYVRWTGSLMVVFAIAIGILVMFRPR